MQNGCFDCKAEPLEDQLCHAFRFSLILYVIMSLFRTLLRLLMSNEQLTQKLAESYPMRRAAQLTAYMYHRGKALSEESFEKMKESEAASRLQETAKNTGDKMREFQRTLEDEIKKQQRK